MNRTGIIGALTLVVSLGLGWPGGLAAQRLYRGGIAYNDFGHGPSGGHGGHVHGGGNHGGHGYHPHYHGGYGSARPWIYGHSSLWLGVGSPWGYSTLGYYNGPWYGSYYGYLRPTYYQSVVIDGYGYTPYGGYYSPYDGGLDFYLPPTYYPAELGYGPRAMDRFLGVDDTLAAHRAAKGAADAKAIVAARPVVKEVDWEARKKADRYIELGDKYFGEQKFYDARLRYKLAIDAAPDYAMAHLRYAFGLLAASRYEEAAARFTQAFTLDPQIVASGFRIDQLYGDNRISRESHEELLAKAATDNPRNGDLYYVLGMWLVFHGQPERSARFFEQAQALGVQAAKVPVATAQR